MDFQFYIIALAIVSILTTVTTEAIKNLRIKGEKDFVPNRISAVMACILSVAYAIIYYLLKNVQFDLGGVIQIIVLAYFAFLMGAVGYDKVHGIMVQISELTDKNLKREDVDRDDKVEQVADPKEEITAKEETKEEGAE